ncbi:MAG: RNA polymerase sigma factor [Pseudomonadota bacterium]
MSFDAEFAESDEALLERYAAGDQSAARALTLRLTPRVLALATRMLRDAAEAEDVAQDAMLRLWKIAPDWRLGEAKVTTWLHRVTANLCIDRLRRKGRGGPPLEDIAEPSDPAPSVEARLVAADRVSAVRRAINELPERQRIAVTLRHFEEMSNPEIGEALGVSVEAVESLLSRGRRTLSKRLNEGER